MKKFLFILILLWGNCVTAQTFSGKMVVVQMEATQYESRMKPRMGYANIDNIDVFCYFISDEYKQYAFDANSKLKLRFSDKTTTELPIFEKAGTTNGTQTTSVKRNSLGIEITESQNSYTAQAYFVIDEKTIKTILQSHNSITDIRVIYEGGETHDYSLNGIQRNSLANGLRDSYKTAMNDKKRSEKNANKWE